MCLVRVNSLYVYLTQFSQQLRLNECYLFLFPHFTKELRWQGNKITSLGPYSSQWGPRTWTQEVWL